MMDINGIHWDGSGNVVLRVQTQCTLEPDRWSFFSPGSRLYESIEMINNFITQDLSV